MVDASSGSENKISSNPFFEWDDGDGDGDADADADCEIVSCER